MSSRIIYCKDIYYSQVFLLAPAKGLTLYYSHDCLLVQYKIFELGSSEEVPINYGS